MKQPSSRRQTPLPRARLVLVGGFLALHHLVIRGIALTLDQLGVVEVHHVWRY